MCTPHTTLVGEIRHDSITPHGRFSHLFPERRKTPWLHYATIIQEGLYSLPALITNQYIYEEYSARKHAEEFQSERLIYTLGSGPRYGLAYKFGLTVFLENMRVNGSFIDATEFRHGPVEVFGREKPAIVILIGTDSSRGVVERVRQLCQTQGAHLLVCDPTNYPGIHPQLAPFALMIPLQWFAVWSSQLRGVTDMDDRFLMGRGHTWGGNWRYVAVIFVQQTHK